jgi:hypothetical protein
VAVALLVSKNTTFQFLQNYFSGENIMFEDSWFSDEVTDFTKLGTGHRRTKVVVVDQNHRILFIAEVRHNRPLTTGKLSFDNKKRFDLKFRTIEHQKVSLFLWTEKLERRWRWQCEIAKICRWIESARPEDVIVLSEFVAQESGLPKISHLPIFVILAKREIEERLVELSLVQLQRLTELLFSVPERMAA